jgi:hypothetical protein
MVVTRRVQTCRRALPTQVFFVSSRPCVRWRQWFHRRIYWLANANGTTELSNDTMLVHYLIETREFLQLPAGLVAPITCQWHDAAPRSLPPPDTAATPLEPPTRLLLSEPAVHGELPPLQYGTVDVMSGDLDDAWDMPFDDTYVAAQRRGPIYGSTPPAGHRDACCPHVAPPLRPIAGATPLCAWLLHACIHSFVSCGLRGELGQRRCLVFAHGISNFNVASLSVMAMLSLFFSLSTGRLSLTTSLSLASAQCPCLRQCMCRLNQCMCRPKQRRSVRRAASVVDGRAVQAAVAAEPVTTVRTSAR